MSNNAIRIAAQGVPTMRIEALKPYERNAKKHGARQIEQLRASLREFGFVAPVLIDEEGNVLAGHGRLEAARAEGMTEVPCVRVSELSEAQRRAYILADNRLSELGDWDMDTLQFEMRELAGMEFDTSLTGFELGEKGVVIFDEIHSSKSAPALDDVAEDDFDVAPPVRQLSAQGRYISWATIASCAATLRWLQIWLRSWEGHLRRWCSPILHTALPLAARIKPGTKMRGKPTRSQRTLRGTRLAAMSFGRCFSLRSKILRRVVRRTPRSTLRARRAGHSA